MVQRRTPPGCLGLLQEEGVLTREQLYLGEGRYGEGVRIVFQAFADFLLLQRRLALSDDPLTDSIVKTWLTEECSWGVTRGGHHPVPRGLRRRAAGSPGGQAGRRTRGARKTTALWTLSTGPTALPLTCPKLALPRLASDLAAHDRPSERCAALHVPLRVLPGALHAGAATGQPPERRRTARLPAPSSACQSGTATSGSPRTTSCPRSSARQPALPAGRRLARTRSTTPKWLSWPASHSAGSCRLPTASCATG